MNRLPLVCDIGLAVIVTVLGNRALGDMPTSTATFVVAPDGDDTNPGTLEKPFATIERARDAVVAARVTHPPDASFVVDIRGGRYFLPVPLSLVKEDSGTTHRPVVYQAHAKEKPVLYGGVPVKDFRPVDEMPGTLVADLASLRLHNVQLGALFRLLPDGRVERLTKARYPNANPADPIKGGWATAAGDAIAQADDIRGAARKTLVLVESDCRDWKTPAEGFVNVFAQKSWWNDLCNITAIDRATHTAKLGIDCSRAIQPGDRFFLEGLREELDAPGEWYFDATAARLYVRPPQGAGVGSLTVLVPQGRTILSLTRLTENITVRGLTFRASEGSAVIFNGVKGCTLAGCTIEHCGDYYGAGVALDQAEGNLVTGCDISFTGSHGLVLDGGEFDSQQRLRLARNRILNNVVHHTGGCYKQGAGIAVVGVGDEVARNFVYDCPRMGIMVGGNAHIVERNVVRRVNRETQDSSGIYIAGRELISGLGTVIRDNLIEDTGGMRRDPDGSWIEGQGTYGILLDTHASGVDVIGNVVVRAATAGIRLENGRGNRIIDNLICDSSVCPPVEVAAWPPRDPRWDRDIQTMGWMYDKAAALPAWKQLRAMELSPKECLAHYGTLCVDNTIERNVALAGVPASLALDARGLGPYQDDLRARWPIEATILPETVAPPKPAPSRETQ